MFRRSLFKLAIVFHTVLLSSCTNSNIVQLGADQNTESKKATGFAVIELFTSEGCSSCPSADRAVEELAMKYPNDVFILAFHVDYWNRLGWVDSFSQASYTQRQSNYAAQFNLSSIYTPQVVVNGHQEFVGSNKSKLESAIATELKQPVKKVLELDAESKDGKTIIVHYTTEINDKQKLNIALIQNEATIDIKRGENGGRKLHHINIVRDYKSQSAAQGTVEFQLPQNLFITDIKIIAYVQDATGEVIAAAKTDIK